LRCSFCWQSSPYCLPLLSASSIGAISSFLLWENVL
jgi:hypothetical protein